MVGPQYIDPTDSGSSPGKRPPAHRKSTGRDRTMSWAQWDAELMLVAVGSIKPGTSNSELGMNSKANEPSGV